MSNPGLGEPKPDFDLLDPAGGLDFGMANPDLSSQSLCVCFFFEVVKPEFEWVWVW